MKLLFKVTIILIWVGILGCIGYILLIASAFGMFDKDYSVSELKEHFTEHQSEMNDLRAYVQQITPKDKGFNIEFSDDNTLEMFHIDVDNKYDTNWNLSVSSSKTDSLVKQLGWTTATLETLKKKLDKAGCISVESGEPTTIGFQRSGLGKYYYKVFEKPMPDSLKAEYNGFCEYIIVNEKLVLEYGGGAVGPQCFPNKE